MMRLKQILPKTAVPIHYSLCLKPSLTTPVFTGTCSISLNILSKTKIITANALDLNISKASISTNQKLISINVDKEAQTVQFSFSEEIPVGLVDLHVEFEGCHNDLMAGFYRSSYTENGEKKYLLATQFQASDARRAFPCWDEPNLKATFDVSMIVPKETVALSNMDVVRQVDQGNNLKKVEFERTPVMSTYLLAFVVGDFEYLEAIANPKAPAGAKPVRIRTYTLKGQKELGRFSLEFGVRVLEFFSKYFDISYPLTKMDQLAIPDFSAGAMENWGLVLYRESSLLFDPKTSSARDKTEVADTVAHEIAHQWFGNLVTMDWWDELWLNEGFATWVGSLAVDRLLPEMDFFTTFVADYSVEGMSYDSLKASHPIQVEVFDPAEVQEIFDAISYFKGASVIRMLEAFIGSENFKNGVIQYLKKHSYKNATTTDLWNALSEASGRNVGLMMSSWTEKVGFPVVKIVGQSFDSKNSELTLDLWQERFIASGEKVDDNTVWHIPITVVTDTSKCSHHLLETKQGKITFPYAGKPNSFFAFNVNATGFFKTLYTREQLLRLSSALADDINIINVKDRVALINDIISFAEAGLVDTLTVLETLSKGFVGEENAIVLEAIGSSLGQIKNTFYEDEKLVIEINRIIRGLFSPRISRIGFTFNKDDDYLLQKKRALIIKTCAHADDKEVIAELSKLFKKYVDGDHSAIDPNLFKVTFVMVLRHAPPSERERALEQVTTIYKTSTNLTAKLEALESLASVNDIKLVHDLLYNHYLDSNFVKTQDLPQALNGLYSVLPGPPHQKVLDLKLKWLFDNLPQLHEKCGMGLERIFRRCLDGHCGESAARRIEDWSKSDPSISKTIKAAACDRAVLTAVESIRIKDKWFTRDHAGLFEALQML